MSEIIIDVTMSMMKRVPDVVIGEIENPYLLRWYIIPRNRFFNIYLHKIIRSDEDRALHDHPWWSIGIILKGWYVERDKKGDHYVGRFRPRLRSASYAHRLIVYSSPVWTLFITGPKIREWGFHCPKGWRHWRDFTAGPNGETVGRGCE